MDGHLELLGEASLAAEAAETALAAGAHQTARDRADAAGDLLAALRERWPTMRPADRAVVGPAARAVRERVDATTRRLPRRSALAEIPAEPDPEEQLEPEAA